MYLALTIRCTEMNQSFGGLGEQGQDQGLTEKNILPYWKNSASDVIYNPRPKNC